MAAHDDFCNNRPSRRLACGECRTPAHFGLAAAGVLDNPNPETRYSELETLTQVGRQHGGIPAGVLGAPAGGPRTPAGTSWLLCSCVSIASMTKLWGKLCGNLTRLSAGGSFRGGRRCGACASAACEPAGDTFKGVQDFTWNVCTFVPGS